VLIDASGARAAPSGRHSHALATTKLPSMLGPPSSSTSQPGHKRDHPTIKGGKVLSWA